MQHVTLEEAKQHLDHLFEAALGGEEVFISKDDRLSIQLVPREKPLPRRQFGSAKGLIEMSENFDAPLSDFNGYLK